jgi:hypothetical protein
MKFTVTPESISALLNLVGKGQTKNKNSLVTFSASRNGIAVIFNGMQAGQATPVQGRGQFAVNWKLIANLLKTYPQTAPVQMECSGGRLIIGSFSTPVQNYQSEPVPEKASLPPPKPARHPKKPETTPQRQASSDGYSPPPPHRNDNDCTGVAGMVSAADFTGPREPVTCPVCKQVGYNEKHLFNGNTYYSRRRSWITASEAPNRVVLTGAEESILCPECLEVRLHTNKHITPVAGSQADLFDKR